jgi:hypothetical protein
VTPGQFHLEFPALLTAEEIGYALRSQSGSTVQLLRHSTMIRRIESRWPKELADDRMPELHSQSDAPNMALPYSKASNRSVRL